MSRRRVLLLALVAFAAALLAGCRGRDLKAEWVSKCPYYRTTAFGPKATNYNAFARQMVKDYGTTRGVCVDVGGSYGLFGIELAKMTEMTVYCVDIDVPAIRLCNILTDEAGLTGRVIAVEGDAQALPFPDEFAELVFCRGVIQFLPDRVAGMRECYRILKPGGVAYVGGGWSRLMDPKLRRQIAIEREKKMEGDPDQRLWAARKDYEKFATEAGIPRDQFRYILDAKDGVTYGYWIEMRKPADRTDWYRRRQAAMKSCADETAQYVLQQYGKKAGRCLELGSGAGDLSLALAPISQLQFAFVGQDADAARLAERMILAVGCARRFEAVHCPPHELAYRDGSFDLVVGEGGPAVWEKPEAVLREVARVLRPGGLAVLGVGAPPGCAPEAAAKYATTRKGLNQADDAPPTAAERAVDRATLEKWVAAAQVKATVVSRADSLGLWLEMRKQH